MKNIKTLTKDDIIGLFTGFNLLLSVIGIIAAFVAVKKEQYNNPLLFALPLSVVLWVFFVFVPVPRPQEKENTEEETEVSIKFSRLQVFLIEMLRGLILTVGVIIILTDFTMMLFMALKTTVIPAFFSP